MRRGATAEKTESKESRESKAEAAAFGITESKEAKVRAWSGSKSGSKESKESNQPRKEPHRNRDPSDRWAHQTRSYATRTEDRRE